MAEVRPKTNKLLLKLASNGNTTDVRLLGLDNINAKNLRDQLNKVLHNKIASESGGDWQWVVLEITSRK
jgi:hypothetical protein